jgi:hypothetical protein
MKWPLVSRKRYELLAAQNEELVKQNNQLLYRDAVYAAIERRNQEVMSAIDRIEKAAKRQK